MHPIAQREFLKRGAGAAAGIGALPSLAPGFAADADATMDMRSFLKSILYTKKESDLWLAGKAFPKKTTSGNVARQRCSRAFHS